MQLEEVDLLRADARHLVSPPRRNPRRLQRQGIPAVVDGDGRRADAHPLDADGGRAEGPGILQRRQDHRRRPVTDGGGVEEPYRIGDGGRVGVPLRRDGGVEHGVGVVLPVLMGVDDEVGEVLARPAVLVHVAPHEQRVEGYEGDPLAHLVLGVSGHGEGRRRLAPAHVRHLLHARDQHQVVEAAGDGHGAHPQGRRARSAGRLDLHGLHAEESQRVGDQNAQMLLSGDLSGDHIAHVDGVHLLHIGVLQRRQRRVQRQLADAGGPVLLHRCLSQADNSNVSHNCSLLT